MRLTSVAGALPMIGDADDGEVTEGSTEAFLRSYMEEFHGFIARVLSVLPRDA